MGAYDVLDGDKRRGLITLCAAVVVLTGACSAPSSPHATGTPGSPSADGAAPAPAATSLTGGAASPTPSANRATWAAYVSDLAELYKIENPPKVDVVRVVEPEERPAVFSQCMGDAGFPPSPNGTFYATEEQTPAFNLAFYTCTAQYPIDDRYLQARTESQLRFIYDYWLDEELPCLERLGHPIPPPPTFETVVGTAESADRYAISGELLKTMGQSEMESVLAACPEEPRAADVYAH